LIPTERVVAFVSPTSVLTVAPSKLWEEPIPMTLMGICVTWMESPGEAGIAGTSVTNAASIVAAAKQGQRGSLLNLGLLEVEVEVKRRSLLEAPALATNGELRL